MQPEYLLVGVDPQIILWPATLKPSIIHCATKNLKVQEFVEKICQFQFFTLKSSHKYFKVFKDFFVSDQV